MRSQIEYTSHLYTKAPEISQTLCCKPRTLRVSLFLLVLHTHFAPDSYNHIFDSWETFESQVFLSRAGYTDAILRGAQLLLGFNIVLDQRMFYILMIISTALSITLVSQLFINQQKCDSNIHSIVINLLCMLAFINPFIIELMLYPECAIFIAAGSLCTAASVRIIAKKGWRAFLLSTFFLILALGAYQAYLGVYIALASSFLWLNQREAVKVRSFFAGWIRLVAVGLASALFQIIFMRLYSILFSPETTYGTVSVLFSDIDNNFFSILVSHGQYCISAFGASYLIPFCSALFISVVFLAIALRKLPKRQWITLAFALLASYCSVFIIHTIAAELFIPLRSVFGFWAVIAFFLCIPTVVLASDSLQKEDSQTRLFDINKVNSVASLSLSTFLVVCVCMVVWDISIDNCKTNEVDVFIAHEIDAKLTEYEHETGVEITSFAAMQDESPQPHYQGVRRREYEYNMSARGITWSLTYLINWTNERELSTTEIPEEVIHEYFDGRNWDTFFLDEQLVIVEDQAYYCSY